MSSSGFPLQKVSLVVLLVIAAGCASLPAEKPTLYQQFGGAAGVNDLANAFIMRLAEDPLVVDSFADTDMEQFHGHISDQFCSLMGGGCEYTGRDMVEAHQGMNIDPRQFNALVEDLMQAMDDVDIPQGAQNRLLQMLAPMYGDMVQ
jgi:hemoglobin